MKRRHVLTGGMLAFALALLAVIGLVPAAAQENLLRDPGFEGPYVNRGRSTLNTPEAWPLWIQDGPTAQIWENRADLVYAFPHCTAPQVLSGPCSLNINGGFATWNAAVYQQVTVPNNANLVGSVGAYVQTCNSRDANNNFVGFACGSAVESGVFVRVGIDPTGGVDPSSPAIVWGAPIAPHDRWETASVSATARGTTATFFIYTSMTWPSDFNNRWYDNALLVVGGPGGTSGSVSNPARPTPRPTSALPTRQPADASGAQYHVVQYGDTLSGIAVIYGISLNTLLSNNDLTMAQARSVPVGTRLLVRRA
jgi:hypothetical protein